MCYTDHVLPVASSTAVQIGEIVLQQWFSLMVYVLCAGTVQQDCLICTQPVSHCLCETVCSGVHT